MLTFQELRSRVYFEEGSTKVPPLKTIPPSCEQHQSRRLRSRHLWSIQAHLTIRTTLLGFEYMDQHPGSKNSARVLRTRNLGEQIPCSHGVLSNHRRVHRLTCGVPVKLLVHETASGEGGVAPEDHVSPSCEQCQSRRLQSQHLWSIRTCLRCLTIRRTLLDVEYMDQRLGSKHSAQVLHNPNLAERISCSHGVLSNHHRVHRWPCCVPVRLLVHETVSGEGGSISIERPLGFEYMKFCPASKNELNPTFVRYIPIHIALHTLRRMSQDIEYQAATLLELKYHGASPTFPGLDGGGLQMNLNVAVWK
ncbi:hypothetical protein IW261DRAFT_1430391 [Armillaria novae-zelandiae]|uniref:Uncharacterized protein n=1 Tax=Armillaria novae-zelandiae TaxID=153914 RepID=A0AA39KCX3_9AGAR|nr:hypothetical protein IW261DRAFT_1430391 [Armillaria novae-zelandiae]